MSKESRAVNLQADVLDLIRKQELLSRADIASAFSLDKKTVSLLVDELLRKGLIARAGFRDSLAGRRQELFSLHGEYGNFIGIDLGATHIIGILGDLNGRPLDRIFFGIRPGLPVDIILGQMKAICGKLLGSEKATASIDAIAICAPGFINPATGTSIIAENIPGWHDVKLKEIFETEFERPVLTEDASRAYAFAENWIGEGRDRDNFLLADLGFGIGMAMVMDGSLYAGAGNKSGELGHLVVKPAGPLCSCGNRGCLESVASGQALARDAFEGILAGKSALLGDLTQGRPETVTAQDVCVAANMGDPFCSSLINAAGDYIGMALADAVSLLNPSRVILGGGLIGENKALLGSISSALEAYCMKSILADMDLVVSKLGIDGSALGSVLLASSGSTRSGPSERD